ncbi:MAG TPA: sigma factor [Acidimicrobiales bacterium]|nr:sigma factor [Acidimicrobiales bacterium]
MAGRTVDGDADVNHTTPGMIGGLKIIAPLSVQEERRLYPVIVRGREAAVALESTPEVDGALRRRLLRQRHVGQEAESLLLRATCGLVRRRVHERGYRFGNEELEAAGVEGLVNALHRFDPDRGTRFSTYANYWIMKLVNQAVQQQAGLSDSEMRLVLQLQKLQRGSPDKHFTRREVARVLKISQVKAAEVMQMSGDLNSRRFEPTEFSDERDLKQPTDPADAPAWVIEELRRICGTDFDAFWQYTFRTMSLEEIARTRGISRQGMAKRIERLRRAVRESPEVRRLQAWFDQQ